MRVSTKLFYDAVQRDARLHPHENLARTQIPETPRPRVARGNLVHLQQAEGLHCTDRRLAKQPPRAVKHQTQRLLEEGNTAEARLRRFACNSF